MSAPESTKWFQSLWNSSALRLQTAAVLTSGFVVLWLLNQVILAPWRVFVALGVLMVVGVRWSAAPILVFAFIAGLLVLVPNHFLGAMPMGDPLSLSEYLLGAAVIAYVGLHYRLQATVEMERRRRERPETGQQEETGLRGIVVATAMGLASAFVAFRALPYFYIGRAMTEDVPKDYVFIGFLFAMVIGGAILFLLTAAARLIGRSSMNALEAETILNDEAYRALYPDLRRMVRRRQSATRSRN